MDGRDAPPARAGKAEKRSGVAALINSPAGVTLLGFFLTGVLGALVSFSVNAFQRWDQQQTQTLAERENEISSVNKQFVGAIVQRTFYTDAVLEAIKQSKAGSRSRRRLAALRKRLSGGARRRVAESL